MRKVLFSLYLKHETRKLKMALRTFPNITPVERNLGKPEPDGIF